jgi:hypothetical protein
MINNDTTFQLDKMECNYYNYMEIKKELLQLKNIYNDLNKDFTEMKELLSHRVL